MKHVLSVLVLNKSGVLNRITGLYSRRGFNIDSLSVGTTQDPEVSRITIVVDGDEYVVDQISKQLDKLIEVIKIKELPRDNMIGREMCYIKVRAQSGDTVPITQLANIFRANIIDAGNDSLTIMLTGTNSKIEAITKLLEPYGILEMVRSGFMAIERGASIVDGD